MADRPFYKPDPLWWPSIADVLPKPWPFHAIEHDLVWWADQVAVGKVARMPGGVELARRWGVSRFSRRVREALGYSISEARSVFSAGEEEAGTGAARVRHGCGTGAARIDADNDDCTSPAGTGAARVRHAYGTGAARQDEDCDAKNEAIEATNDEAPRARVPEPRAQIPEPIHEIPPTPHDAPAQAVTDPPDGVLRAGVQDEVRTPSAPLPIRSVPPLPVPPRPAETPPALPLVLLPPPDTVDVLWESFSTLAVSHGLVRAPPKPTAIHQGKRTRSDVLAALAKAEGKDRVLAVWRWLLTSPGRTACWWRDARRGPELIGSFLVHANFTRLADAFDAERENGIRFPPRAKGEVLPLPTMDPEVVAYWDNLSRRQLKVALRANGAEELDDAGNW